LKLPVTSYREFARFAFSEQPGALYQIVVNDGEIVKPFEIKGILFNPGDIYFSPLKSFS
jgi:hypothetical protein